MGDGAGRSGSSPLARGLRVIRRRRVGGVGIIPARAGFTPAVGGVAHSSADHPRSRGVYNRARSSGTASAGSSPLARGLPDAPGIASES